MTALYEQIRRGALAETHMGGQGRVAIVELPPFLQAPAGESVAQPDMPFVAREQELARLQSALDEAKTGRGRPRFVIGGPGRGKTTLLTEFARRALAADPDLLVISGHANAYTGIGDPYLPWRAALNLLLGDVEAGVTGGQLTLEQARRLWRAMSITLPLLADHAPFLVGPFISGRTLLTRVALVTDSRSDWLPRLEKAAAASARQEQSRLFAQLTALLHAIAAQRPLLLILEDLHWADTSSINLLFHCCRQLSGHPICLVGTYRHNAIAVSWDGHPHPLVGVMAELKRQYGDIWLDLAAVDATQGRHFVDAYLNAQAVAVDGQSDQSFAQALFAKTGGHPLFTVELVHDLQLRGDLQQAADGSWVAARPIDGARLPAKVEGVIEQRLATLAEDLRQALTIAGVEGEVFTAEVVAQVQGGAARTLVQRLSGDLDRQHRLVSAQALEWVGSQRLARYRFRHHLFQRYLYQQLDESERVYLHEAVGEALESLYGEQVAECAVPLARHFRLAGQAGKAIHYLQIAAQSAVRKSAYSEAIAHLRLALNLLTAVPQSATRDPQELSLQLALGQALIAVKGYGVPEVAQAFSRARELCAQITELAHLFPILYGLYTYYFTRAEHSTAGELAEQMWHLAQSQPDSGYLIMAHRALGLVSLQIGEFAASRQHLAQVITLYDPQRHHEWVLQSGGIDSGVMSHATIAFAHWYLGYPEQMLASVKASIVLAEQLDHPFSLAAALGFAGFAHQFRGEVTATKRRAAEVIALCRTQKFPLWIPLATCLLGWVLAEEGETAAGIAQIQQGLETLRATGTELLRPRCLALLAEAYGRAGQVGQATQCVADALRLVEASSERSHEAELHRLHGELLLREGAAAQAEACFFQAIQVAQQQNAKSWELRATMSLCRLWQTQSKSADAQQSLAAIVGWFSEGFDTADLIEAKALLA